MTSVNQISSYIDMSSNYVDKGVNFISQNKILSSVLGMLLVLYAAAAAPKLSPSVVKIFDNNLFKLVYIFLIGYLATKDPSVAIITAVTLLVSIQTLSAHEASIQAVFNANSRAAKKISSELVSSVQENVTPTALTEPIAPVINSTKNILVNIKDVFGKTKEVKIPLSPSRAEFIEECTKRANKYYEIANEAQSTGNIQLANDAKNEAAKQEIKAESIVIAKQHIMAAQEANASGNQELAQAHINEATQQEEKARALLKAEVHAIAAIEANQRGAVEEAQQHHQASLQEEAKALSLLQPQEVPIQQDVFLPSPDASNAGEHAQVDNIQELVPCNNNRRIPCNNNVAFDMEGYAADSFTYANL
jgi:hypothetical protein